MGAVTFSTEDGLTLEGELRPADGVARGTAVLCHPHPGHGGSKDHPVLWAIRNDLAGRRGLTVLTFNFRGVMGSEGTYGKGRTETEDVAAALARVKEEADGPTVLVGWSFGAVVALRHALADHSIQALILVAVPVGDREIRSFPLPTIEELDTLRPPVLLVAGDRDEYCPVPSMRNLARWIPASECLVLEDAGHLFRRRERELAAGIGEWVDRRLARAGQARP